MNIAILFIILILVIVVVFFAYKQGIFGGGVVEDEIAQFNDYFNSNADTLTDGLTNMDLMLNDDSFIDRFICSYLVLFMDQCGGVKYFMPKHYNDYWSKLPNFFSMSRAEREAYLKDNHDAGFNIQRINDHYNKTEDIRDNLYNSIVLYDGDKNGRLYQSLLDRYEFIESVMFVKRPINSTGRRTKPALRKQYSDDDEEATF